MPSFLSRLFGQAAPKGADPILHKNCRILPAPIKEGSAYRIAARVEKDFDGQTRVHQLTRADTSTSLDEATQIAIQKAKQAIDQLGDSLFS